MMSDEPRPHFCSWCGNEIGVGEFKDKLSYREFLISGLCSICQKFEDEDDEGVEPKEGQSGE